MAKKTNGERAVLVTTAHKGVFFGYATATDGAIISLRAARNCIYWPTWTDAQRSRMEELRALGAKICFWRSKKDGTAIHGKKITPASVGLVQSVNGPLELCSNRALHATLIPPKWEGDRLWIVALIGETVGDDEKYGALQREIIGEAL